MAGAGSGRVRPARTATSGLSAGGRLARQLPGTGGSARGTIQVTALNFGDGPVAGSVRSEVLPPDAIVTDMSSGEQIGDVDNLGAFGVALGAYQSMALEVTHIGAASPQ